MSVAGLQGNALRGTVKWFQNGSMEPKNDRGSLNPEIIQALEMEAAEAERRRQLRTLRKELDRFAASLPSLVAAFLDDSAPLIRAHRER
jgi:hypothetical protein